MTDQAIPPLRKYGGVSTTAQEQSSSPDFTNGNRIDNADFVTANESQDLKRGLSQRHISLIAIAGAIVSLSASEMNNQLCD